MVVSGELKNTANSGRNFANVLNRKLDFIDYEITPDNQPDKKNFALCLLCHFWMSILVILLSWKIKFW